MSCLSPRSMRRLAYTLIETVVAIAILAILVALLLPAVQRARDAAARYSCANRLRQLGLAVHAYAAARGHLPIGCDYSLVPKQHRQRSPGLSWHSAILSYVEQEELWRQIVAAHQADPTAEADTHHFIRRQSVTVFTCPAIPSVVVSPGTPDERALTSYLGVAGTGVHQNDGSFHRDLEVRFRDFKDGTSNTVMIGERPPAPSGRFAAWYSTWGSYVCPLTQVLAAGYSGWETEGVGCPPFTVPLRPGRLHDPCDMNHYWSQHIGGANFVFADGSVRLLSYKVGPLLPQLATRAGREVVVVD